MAHQVVDRTVRIDRELANARRDLPQVVGRNIRAHPHGDAARPVDQEVGNAPGEHDRLLPLSVEVVDVVDGAEVDVLQQLRGYGIETGLGVAVGRGRVAVDRAEVALPIDQGVPQREVLHHAHHGVVDRRIAMRVVFAQDVSDDGRALLVGTVGRQRQLVHRVENAAMDRLQSVSNIG